MAMTASITTPDGVEHSAAFAKVYPLTLQVLPGDERFPATLHCWHSAASFAANAAELSGYPQDITLSGAAAQQSIMDMMLSVLPITLTGDPEVDGPATIEAVIAALEEAVIALRPEFSRVV